MVKHILIVEDDTDTAKIIQLRIEARGYKTAVARDGEEGWRMIQKEKPDLVILDVMLPGVDGYTIASMMKDDKKLSKIPIIMSTAKDSVGDVDKGFTAGVSHYLIKPYDWDRLYKKIDALL